MPGIVGRGYLGMDLFMKSAISDYHFESQSSHREDKRNKDHPHVPMYLGTYLILVLTYVTLLLGHHYLPLGHLLVEVNNLRASWRACDCQFPGTQGLVPGVTGPTEDLLGRGPLGPMSTCAYWAVACLHAATSAGAFLPMDLD